jgi:hypothetical protein
MINGDGNVYYGRWKQPCACLMKRQQHSFETNLYSGTSIRIRTRVVVSAVAMVAVVAVVAVAVAVKTAIVLYAATAAAMG